MTDDQDEDNSKTINLKIDNKSLDELHNNNRRKAKKVNASAQLKRKTGGLSLQSSESVFERKKKAREAEEFPRKRTATYAQRVQAGAVDLGVAFVLYKVASIEKLTYNTEELFFRVQDATGIQFEISDTLLDYLLIILNFCFFYFFIQVCVTWLTQKSIGKMVFKIHLVSFDSNKISFFQAIKREAIFKPLGVIFLLSFIIPFFNDDNESFHDKLGGTFVAQDE
jgi:uncharacterized RDD family membrane protein YckC